VEVPILAAAVTRVEQLPHQAKEMLAVKAEQYLSRAAVEVVLALWVLQAMELVTAAMACNPPFLGLQRITQAAVVELNEQLVRVRVVLVEVVRGLREFQAAPKRLLALQTQAVVEVEVLDRAHLLRTAQTVVLVLSSSGMPTHLMTLLQPQALRPSATLAGLKFTHGPGLVQSHSEVTHGTLCTT